MAINNGWLLQWGVNSIGDGGLTITLPKAYKNTKYGVVATIRTTSDPNSGTQSIMIAPISVSQIRGYMDWISNRATLNTSWICFGT